MFTGQHAYLTSTTPDVLSEAIDLLECLTLFCMCQAHQWFGDLVTLDDWTELWLNEGFAEYLENVGKE